MMKVWAILLSFMVANAALAVEEAVLKEYLLSATAEKYNTELNDAQREGLIRQALSFGAQGGRYITLGKILDRLESRADTLTDITDFRHVMMHYDGHLLLPAKIVKTDGRRVIADNMVRTERESYRIAEQPKFVSVMPTWRDYFRFDNAPPELTRKNVLPTNSEEQAIWKEHILKGWEAGVEQAKHTYRSRMKLLLTDYQAYVRYHLMADRNMVSKPQFERSYYDVSGGGEAMRIDEVFVKVVVNPQLIANRDAWEPLPLLPEVDSLLSGALND